MTYLYRQKKVGIVVGVAIIFTSIFFSITTSTPHTTHAQEGSGPALEYTPLSPLPLETNGGNPSELSVYLPAMFKFLIAIAGVLAVIMIVIGGIQYMSTDAVYGKSEGKEKITQALGGLFLALIAWLILYTINPDTLNTTLNIPEIPDVPPATSQTGSPLHEQPTSYYAQIKTYPLQEGAPAQQTFCEGPYTTPELCTTAKNQLLASTYAPPNYQVYESSCTTQCQPQTLANQEWVAKIYISGGPGAFTDCLGNYANKPACEANLADHRAEYSPPHPNPPQPPNYNCVVKTSCVPMSQSPQ